MGQKNAVVTGAAMGIGLATTKRLLEEGYNVSMWDMNEEALNNAAAEIDLPERIFTHICDVSDKKRVYELAETVKQEMGHIEALVNNAGIVRGGDLLDQPDEAWEQTIAVNFTSLIYTTRAFLPEMYEQNNGTVVNISSASSLLGVGGLAVYAATKWAVWGLTESLRFEAHNRGKKGVHFASVHPSYIATGLFAGAQLGILGNLIVPRLKSHDVIAKAVVKSAIQKKRLSPKRPRSVNLTMMMRGLLPDSIFQKILILLGVHNSMNSWKGREK